MEKAMGEKPTQHQTLILRLAATARHPLAAVVLGFALTGILATAFSKWLDYRSQMREAQSSAYARAIESVRQVSDLLYERRIRGVLLSSSIRRHAREAEVLARKSAFDDVVVRWNSTLMSNLFRIRRMSGLATPYTAFEHYFEDKATPLLAEADLCLTASVDAYLHPLDQDSNSPTDLSSLPSKRIPGFDAWEAAKQKLDGCQIENLHSVMLDCFYQITNALYNYIVTNNTPADFDLVLDKACKSPSQP
jgi:hypothetical protein